jgi:hypothetical protein
MIIIGTEIKININVEPIDDIHLSECDFTATFYANSEKSLVINKEQMIKKDEDNYVALVDSEILGKGLVRLRLEVQIPDKDFPDGYRKEIGVICTGVIIH